VLKDNYDTFDMPTSASSLSLATSIPPDDGFLVRRLREAGAVFLGKTNMHEFAFGITTISSLGGQTLNPYDTRRNPGGSSGGTGAAIGANYAVFGMGSDTCGSIRIPTSHNSLVGLRVTQGQTSRDGIIPLSVTQDVGGPLARASEASQCVMGCDLGVRPRVPARSSASEHATPRSYRTSSRRAA
jgi:Asp-tRNA(Asn)/Glu-tRNA(Gln) amidotransferase A subunit family amidase